MGVFEQLEEIRKAPTSLPVMTGSAIPVAPSPSPNLPVSSPATSITTPQPISPLESSTPATSVIPATPVTPSPTSEPPLPPIPERPMGRSPVRRTITRHSFELFQDQVDALRRLALEEKLIGDKGNMSEMARDAMDAYLAKRKRNSR